MTWLQEPRWNFLPSHIQISTSYLFLYSPHSPLLSLYSYHIFSKSPLCFLDLITHHSLGHRNYYRKYLCSTIPLAVVINSHISPNPRYLEPEEVQTLEQFSETAKTEPSQEHRGGSGHSAEASEGQVPACLLGTSGGSHHTETSRLPHLDFPGTRQGGLGQGGSVEGRERS